MNARAPLGAAARAVAAARSVAVLLVVAVLTVAAPPAGAAEHERITVSEGETVQREYPPIPGNDPAYNEVDTPSPEYCRTASVACDVIPLTFRPPSGSGSEYFVRITLGWEAEPDPTGATSAATNDLDMYLWHDPPGDMTATSTPDDPETEEDESAEVNPGASGRLPEVVNWFSTQPGDYLLLVKNYLGTNTGYTLEVRYFPADAAPPTGFAGVTDPGPAAPSAAPASPAGPRRPTAMPAPPPPPTPEPTLGIEPLTADPDFEEFTSIDLQDELAAPSDVARLQPRSREISIPDDPSSAALVVWMVIVPLVAIGGAGTWLLRRRSSVLRVS